jgi:hypothetical protein
MALADGRGSTGRLGRCAALRHCHGAAGDSGAKLECDSAPGRMHHRHSKCFCLPHLCGALFVFRLPSATGGRVDRAATSSKRGRRGRRNEDSGGEQRGWMRRRRVRAKCILCCICSVVLTVWLVRVRAAGWPPRHGKRPTHRECRCRRGTDRTSERPRRRMQATRVRLLLLVCPYH